MNPEVLTQFDNKPKTMWKTLRIVLTLIVLTALCLPFIQYEGIVDGGFVIVRSILSSLVSPNWKLLVDFTKVGVPYLILETLAIAFLGTFIGMLVAIPFAFLTARNIVPQWLSSIGTVIITIIRTFPPFVYGLMMIRVAGPGAFTGVLTLAITSVGMLSKMFVEAVEDLDQGILESLDASGCNTIQKIRYGIMPQLLGNFLSITIYRLEINVKNASILGLVGAGGIGAPLLFAMSGYRWGDVGALLWGLILLVLCVESISSMLRKRLA